MTPKTTNKPITVFDRPEMIDALINSKLENMPAKSGKAGSKATAWKPEELDLRDGVILQYITEQGLSKERTAQQIYSRWNISLPTARRYVAEAIKRFSQSFVEDNAEEQRRLWLERCETILQDAIDSRDKQSALRALDLMGKSMGIYQEKKDVTVDGEVDIRFDFE